MASRAAAAWSRWRAAATGYHADRLSSASTSDPCRQARRQCSSPAAHDQATIYRLFGPLREEPCRWKSGCLPPLGRWTSRLARDSGAGRRPRWWPSTSALPSSTASGSAIGPGLRSCVQVVFAHGRHADRADRRTVRADEPRRERRHRDPSAP